MFDIDPNEPMEQRVLDETDKIFSSPPILLQLCGLRDLKMKTGMQSLFFDALLNIQLAMAFADTNKTNLVAAFIRDYYTSVEAFFGTESNYGAVVNERYIFKKLCSEALADSAANLKKAGDSFEKYCEISAIEGTPIIPSKVNLKPEAPSREAVAIKKIVNTEPEEQPVNSLRDASDLDRLLKELDDLVGLEAVKAEVRSLINLIKVRALRKKHDLPLMDMSYHMVFTGNPGTGKTTVARLIAGIYRELGILSKGTLVETDRSGLVAGYVGQTAIKVRDVVNKALGGVLFIDEAYALVNQFSNDFGDEALETLVKLMEDHRDDLVVIVAGYTDEMQEFLKANTGLTSRFNKFIT
ncbi:MAG: AAA family ATPase, partial [Lachnospiraceae bacterium]|nr:AAA family ATPase [Lachnospiraceae bacterium]